MTEAEAKKAAAERGWTVQKHDKSYRIVDSDGTLVAADWSIGRRVRAVAGRCRQGARAVTFRLVDSGGVT